MKQSFSLKLVFHNFKFSYSYSLHEHNSYCSLKPVWQRLAPGVPLLYYWKNDEWSQLRIRPYKNLGRWRTAEITSAWYMPFAPHSSFCCRFQLCLLLCSRFHQAWARSICVSPCQWVPLWNFLFFVPQYSVTESYTPKTCFLVLWLAFWNCTRVWSLSWL